jgi:hypothetical protein
MRASLRYTARALLHPVTLIALVLWPINDHVLKGWGPGLLTGKLSDVTALVVCPTVLLGIMEWSKPEWVERHLRALLAASCAAIGLLLAGLELSPTVELTYQHTLASAQYAARYIAAALMNEGAPSYVLVHTTPDVTDLLTLPSLAVPWCLLGRPANDR